jgi:outer membrane protein OmpA-like peptidoglycan-associated protein
MKLRIVAFFILIAGFSANAQLNSLSRADQLFEASSYLRASELYLELVQRGEAPNHVIHNLAECYRQFRDTKNAEIWYAQAVQLRDRKPIEVFHYAQSLKSNEKYNEANNWLRLYNELVPEDRRAIMHLTAGDYYRKYNPVVQNYKISNLTINTKGSDFGPAYFTDDAVVYSSNIKDNDGPTVQYDFAWAGGNYLDLYVADQVAGGALNTPQKFSKNLSTKYHEGPVTFSNDFLQIYFTRNGKSAGNKGSLNLKIYRATLAGNDWVNQEPLPFSSDEFDVCHPTMNEDGTKLYFASNQPGGFGGFDLYEVDFDKGFWGRPRNLGPEINTEGNEVFPFIHRTNVLYFASDGHVGLGGLDVFKSTLTRGAFKNVENLKAPINGPKDDFSFVTDSAKTMGFFASNRPGGVGSDDMYAFVYTEQSDIYSLQGQILDENDFTVSGVNVYAQTKDGEVLSSAVTDEDGFFSFNLNRNRGYRIVTQGGKFNQAKAEVPVFPAGDTKTVTLQVDKNNYSIKGIVMEKATRLQMDNAKVYLIKNSSKQTQEGVTDADGTFSFIIDPNASYTVKVMRPGFLTVSRVITTVGAKPGKQLQITDLFMDKLKVNQVIDVPNVYYDLGKFSIRADAAVELDKVVDFLQENPTVTIELASHSDSRGDAASNLELSQKRAQAAVDYIVSKGIDANQIIAKGYGESKLLNGCKDGVRCSEAQHQANRRTEIKVLAVG